MPNQLNYSENIIKNNPPSGPEDFVQRPDRIVAKDLNLILSDFGKSITFGQTTNDVVELHLYDANNRYIQTHYIYPSDSALTITTMVDENTNSKLEFLNIDMKSALESAGMTPVKYTTVNNFFRNEIGSDFGNKMFISEISPSRTEIKLEPIQIDSNIIKQIYEFIVPSIYRFVAQGLVDQIFAQSADFTPEESIDYVDTKLELSNIDSVSVNRLDYAGLNQNLSNFLTEALKVITNDILKEIEKNPQEFRIQQTELEGYIILGIDKALMEMEAAGLLDKRMKLI